jgi:MSHA pilin protein MshC
MRVAGFTVVELIAALVLMGILATTAMSRMVGRSAYAPALVAQQVVALARLAQQTALSRQDAVVVLNIDRSAGAWRFRVRVTDAVSTNTAAEERADLSNTSVVIENGPITLPLGASDSLLLTFDGLGGLAAATAAATPLNPSIGIGVRVTGDSTAQLCIGSVGHAYRGDCS